MVSRHVRIAVGIAVLVLSASAHFGRAGQPAAPATSPSPPATAEVVAPKVALPSMAAPFEWGTPREVESLPQAEQEKLGIEFLRAFHPLRLEEIERIKSQEPPMYYQTIREALHQRMQIEHLRLENPEEFRTREAVLKIDAQCEQLAMAYRNADPEQKDGIEKQLSALVDKAFDLRQQEMETHLKRLEQEYQRMKRMVEKRHKYRDRVVEIHVLRLLGEREILELW
jgi:hypothetical protein